MKSNDIRSAWKRLLRKHLAKIAQRPDCPNGTVTWCLIDERDSKSYFYSTLKKEDGVQIANGIPFRSSAWIELEEASIAAFLDDGTFEAGALRMTGDTKFVTAVFSQM